MAWLSGVVGLGKRVAGTLISIMRRKLCGGDSSIPRYKRVRIVTFSALGHGHRKALPMRDRSYARRAWGKTWNVLMVLRDLTPPTFHGSVATNVATNCREAANPWEWLHWKRLRCVGDFTCMESVMWSRLLGGSGRAGESN